MNVVSVKSTITCLPPWPIDLEQLLLELGRRVEVDLAGERDDIGSSESCSVLMSKFMAHRPSSRREDDCGDESNRTAEAPTHG